MPRFWPNNSLLETIISPSWCYPNLTSSVTISAFLEEQLGLPTYNAAEPSTFLGEWLVDPSECTPFVQLPVEIAMEHERSPTFWDIETPVVHRTRSAGRAKRASSLPASLQPTASSDKQPRRRRSRRNLEIILPTATLSDSTLSPRSRMRRRYNPYLTRRHNSSSGTSRDGHDVSNTAKPRKLSRKARMRKEVMDKEVNALQELMSRNLSISDDDKVDIDGHDKMEYLSVSSDDSMDWRSDADTMVDSSSSSSCSYPTPPTSPICTDFDTLPPYTEEESFSWATGMLFPPFTPPNRQVHEMVIPDQQFQRSTPYQRVPGRNVSSFTQFSSDITWLPTNVLANIFLHCIPDSEEEPALPWNVMQVCQRFRYAAIDSPEIWTSITINLDRPFTNGSRNLLDLQLHLSAQEPLSITLISPERIRYSQHPAMESLLYTTSRWAHLRIAARGSFMDLLRTQKGNYGKLESLHWEFDEQAPEEHFDAFEKAPNLRRVSLSRPGIGWIKLPWTQIRSLSLHDIANIKGSVAVLTQTDKIKDLILPATDFYSILSTLDLYTHKMEYVKTLRLRDSTEVDSSSTHFPTFDVIKRVFPALEVIDTLPAGDNPISVKLCQTVEMWYFLILQGLVDSAQPATRHTLPNKSISRRYRSGRNSRRPAYY